MRKIFQAVLVILCFAALFAGYSTGHLCHKDGAFICSSFNLMLHTDDGATAVTPDKSCSEPFYACSDLTCPKARASSIFHPPKTTS
ncbi:MAG: hypothetical protein M0033_07870 [Nitrospiraceae bacterium]|nr:hypothetical protein [Nitrospiraceae bacterium]